MIGQDVVFLINITLENGRSCKMEVTQELIGSCQ